jgi:hypothetical protein
MELDEYASGFSLNSPSRSSSLLAGSIYVRYLVIAISFTPLQSSPAVSHPARLSLRVSPRFGQRLWSQDC